MTNSYNSVRRLLLTTHVAINKATYSGSAFTLRTADNHDNLIHGSERSNSKNFSNHGAAEVVLRQRGFLDPIPTDHTKEDIERFIAFLSEELPELDIKLQRDRETLEVCLSKSFKLIEENLMDHAKALKIFLALGDIPALYTPPAPSAYRETLSKAKDLEMQNEDQRWEKTKTSSSYYIEGCIDLFSSAVTKSRPWSSVSKSTDYEHEKELIRKTQHLLSVLLSWINVDQVTTSDTVAQISESFEYLARSELTRQEVERFWSSVLCRLLITKTLDCGDDDLLRFLRHQRDFGEVSVALLDCFVQRASSRIELFQERCVSEMCQVFSDLRYKDSQWIQALARRLPFVLHEWHFSSIISIAEMLVSLDMSAKEIGQTLNNPDAGRELVERLSQELFRWIPSMYHNFPSRCLRALVFLNVESPKTVDFLIKYLPRSLQRYQGLHSFNLLAESFVAYSLTDSKS